MSNWYCALRLEERIRKIKDVMNHKGLITKERLLYFLEKMEKRVRNSKKRVYIES